MLSACVINPYMLSDLGAPQGDRARHRCRKNDTLTIPCTYIVLFFNARRIHRWSGNSPISPFPRSGKILAVSHLYFTFFSQKKASQFTRCILKSCECMQQRDILFVFSLHFLPLPRGFAASFAAGLAAGFAGAASFAAGFACLAGGASSSLLSTAAHFPPVARACLARGASTAAAVRLPLAGGTSSSPSLSEPLSSFSVSSSSPIRDSLKSLINLVCTCSAGSQVLCLADQPFHLIRYSAMPPLRRFPMMSCREWRHGR